MLDKAKFFGRVAIANAVVAAVIAFAFADVGLQTPWRVAWEQFAVAFLLTSCISPTCLYVLPRVTPRVFRKFGFPLNWLIVIGVMVVLAAGGSLFGVSLLAAVGFIKPAQIFVAWLDSSLKVSLIVTITLGGFITGREILRSRLNRALVDLRTKERDEAEAQRVAAEAQLASLESRVQPHFLFNTLNSISALIPLDPAGAEKMTGQLASLLRASLDSASDALVPLSQELKTVRDYLDIERVRFGDRLRFSVDVNADLNDCPVPKLALQTLVENSVKYAVAPRRDGGTIAVRAHKTDGGLRVEVVDDGPGFDGADVPAGHGLSLVRDRLRMTFGPTTSLSIASRPGQTTVTIEIPQDAARLHH